MTIATRDETAILEQVLVNGDLSKLSGPDRLAYYRKVCESLGLNPLTKPFDYLQLQGKLSLYVNRSGTDQIREKHNVSIVITDKRSEEGLYIVSARASLGARTDESTGAVPIEGLKGEARANAIMKAETKAKRRVTLSIVGLGWLDESEVDSIAGAQRVQVNEEGDVFGDMSGSMEHYVQRGPIGAPPTQVVDEQTGAIEEDEEGVSPIGAEKAKMLEDRILGLGLDIDDIASELDAQGWETLHGLTRNQADQLWRTMWRQRSK